MPVMFGLFNWLMVVDKDMAFLQVILCFSKQDLCLSINCRFGDRAKMKKCHY